MNKKIVLALTCVVFAVVLFGVGCKMEVNDPVRPIPIVEPYITVQPQSYSYSNVSYTRPPTLSVEVSDWNRLDGNLSFQWYSFTNLAEYCTPTTEEIEVEVLDEEGNVTGTETKTINTYKKGTAITGATDSTYTPPASAIQDTPGSRYFYYVVVTNEYPDAVGKTKSSIQSEVSIISITATNVRSPVITKHPVGAQYMLGRAAAVAPLEVRATQAAGVTGTITYQWFSNETFSATGGTPIPDADKPMYMPDVSTMGKGESYYYVEVTNTMGSFSSTVTCIPVIIEMLPSEKAVAPRIETHPQDMRLFDSTGLTGTTGGVELKVEATSSDGGTLTYQWYSFDKAIATGELTGTNKDNFSFTTVDPVPTPIALATSETFRPTAAGFYGVTITNTNEEATVSQTAKIESKIATVTVQGAGTVPATIHSVITIPDPSLPANRLNYIRGYGGMDTAWANFPTTTKAETELQYNQEWGLGYNILRIMIVPPASDAGNFVSHEKIITEQLLEKHRPDYLENVKVVNRNGGYVLASPWTPPREWKTNNSINSGGHLIPSYYKSYANYLRAFAQYMYYQGAPIYALSIANEPNYSGGYDGCEWTDVQMRDFWKQVGHFTDGIRGSGGGKSIPSVLTMNGESANTPAINFETLNDPASRAVVDLYARHVYGEQTIVLWDNQYAAKQTGSTWDYFTECWMTEHNINSANPTAFFNDSTWNYIWRFMNDIDLVIRINRENAFVWWASKRFYSMIGDGQSGTTEGAVLPRGYGLSHYAKFTNGFTRINFTMTGNVSEENGTKGADIGTLNRPPDNGGYAVNTTNFSLDNLSAKITAYVSPDGNEISMVMWTPTKTDGSQGFNMGNIQINMPSGFKIGSVKAVRSKAGAINVPDTATVISSDRTTAYVNLPRSEILSVKFTRE